jgi:hypothetical protein
MATPRESEEPAMSEREDTERARRAYDDAANNPRVPRDMPPANLRPGSHSTGGAPAHKERGEGERHSSAPGIARQRDPMATRANEPPRTGRPGVDRNLDTGLSPDNDT